MEDSDNNSSESLWLWKISSVDLTGEDSLLNMACMPEPNVLWWENYLESSGHLWSSWVKSSAGRHSCYQSTCAIQQASGALVGCCYRRYRRSLCGQEMTSDLDGLLETGSSHYRVSAAYERAGFICGARGNVCQLSTWGPWPQSVSLLFGARAQLWFLYQPCWPQGLTWVSSPVSPQNPKMK